VSLQRIIFVDDEANILQGLQNLLRKERRRWDMVFALGGHAALAEMAKAPFDVIVTDMRMPGMDGAALLKLVMERHPGVARIVLSGHADRDAIVRALPMVHQFLSKPCDGDSLRAVIERTCSLQLLLKDQAIRQIAAKLETIPSAPRIYLELTNAVAEDVGLDSIAKIVETDPAMAAKVLQLVNSAYFGLPQRLLSVREAVTYLGIDLIKGLSLSAHVFATVGATADARLLDDIQRRSLLTARAAKRFASDSKRAGEAFTAAILHDIGKIIIAVGLPERSAQIAHDARQNRRAIHLVEKEVLGVTHAEVGAYLLGVWGIPFSIVEAVAYHHEPALLKEGDAEVLAAVHAANTLIDEAEQVSGEPLLDGGLDQAFLERAGFAQKLTAWRAIAQAETRTAAEAQ
jgi:HD-like signal output (HDOD) protein